MSKHTKAGRRASFRAYCDPEREVSMCKRWMSARLAHASYLGQRGDMSGLRKMLRQEPRHWTPGVAEKASEPLPVGALWALAATTGLP